jgi:hypothetical protein
MPALHNARKAIMALDLLYQDAVDNRPIAHLTAEQRRNFDFIIQTKMKPVRLLYDVKISDLKPTDNGIDKQTYHIGEVTIHAMELSKVKSSGPNNVSTDAWSIR